MKNDIISNLRSQLEKHCDSKSPVIWVLGSSINALSFVRSLGRKNLFCIVIDDVAMIGASSKYASFAKAAITDLSSETGLAVLDNAAKKSRCKPVIFATSDSHNEFLANYGYRLKYSCRFCIPDPDTIHALIDKKEQYTRAQKIGISVPYCIYPSNIEYIKNNVGLFTFPCIIKPCKAHLGRKFLNGKKVKVVDTIEELIESWFSLGDAAKEFMVQEIIPGGDTGLYGYLAFWSSDSEEIAWITKQKLRQNPPLYGDGALQITIDCPEIRELSIRLLREFNYKGFVGVEFKLDPRDREFKLMEVNPRTVSGNQLAISAGVDFPYIGYKYLTDKQYSYQGTFENGIKFINEDWDLRSCLMLRKTNEADLIDYIKDLYFSKSKAIWASDDVSPSWLTFKDALKALSGKMARKFKPNHISGMTEPVALDASADLFIQRLSENDFANMETEWSALLTSSDSDCLFMSWAWQYSWWQVWGHRLGLELMLIAAYDKNNNLVGLAPLYRHIIDSQLGLSLTRLQFIGNARQLSPSIRTEYIGMISIVDREHSVTTAIIEYIKDLNWDALTISDCCASTLKKFDQVIPVCTKASQIVRSDDLGVIINTAYTFQTWLNGLGRNTRLKAFNRRNIFCDELGGEFRFIENASEDDCLKFIERLNKFHLIRWGSVCFDDLAIEFHRKLLSRLSSDKVAKLSELVVNGETVSVLYDIQCGSRIYNLQSGYYESFHSKISLGTLHFGFAIENGFQSSLIHSYDLLAGAGKNSFYKSRFNGEKVIFNTVDFVRSPLLKTAFMFRPWLPKKITSQINRLFRF
ncbi:putative ATP-grasp superfamily ATP-dependent carboligase [Methylohalomonas lacus]|uniref:ATP-grasp superfamily ATP-dependent carboligase n=1 Tax=Methylohalomonas lacus TaxID=398773 RepID=A0AAE3L204_9GAMM|nr:GNAT family N-acetyltransferase [Methylohalomonas lacus]MCS3904330.1 putative ATP-grasp superfamily ATP-dependent carboligase [Methylohalomonas lacus]